jgi:glutamine synthetase
MSTKTDFTLEEWETIRNAPYLAAAAVMVAGRSGIFGSIKEALVTAQTFHESAASESPLIKALSAEDEVRLSQEFVSNHSAFAGS